MSDNRKKSEVVKKKRFMTDKMLTRILCIILMVVLVSGTIVSLIYMLISSSMVRVAAAEPMYPEEINFRIGLMYGSSVTVGFETTAPNGFVPGAVDSNNQFTSLWQIDETTISVTIDANLAKSCMTYSKTTSTSPYIGGFHIQAEQAFYDRTTAWEALNAINTAISQNNIKAFAAYVDGVYRIRIGQYASYDSAAHALSGYGSYIGGYACGVASPTNTAVSVVNPNNDEILFEYDCGGRSELGIIPVQSGSETAYLQTPAKNTYCGIFEYSRYISGSTDGVALINIVGLDDYTMGVLPYEIVSTWPLETQKTFAVAVRSYALANLNKHSAYGFDLCNGTECQVYSGMKLVNDNVRTAVEQTSGMVVAYQGKVVSTYFSAVMGGSTVSAKEAWGGSSVPYIVAVQTPWEDYASHKYGEWTEEFTPFELLERVRTRLNANYPTLAKSFNLTGGISKITINSYATNSNYVYSITLSDMSGRTFTIENTDTIRRTLGLLSANFVVGHGGESVEIFTFEVDGAQNTNTLSSSSPSANTQNLQAQTNTSGTVNGGVYVLTANGPESITPGESISVLTASGSATETNLSDIMVRTWSGNRRYNMISEFYNGYNNLFDDSEREIDPNGTDYSGATYKKVYSTITLQGSSSNICFSGKGYGHGVGMSQVGARDLGYNGYTYDKIILAYFPSTTLTDYRNMTK